MTISETSTPKEVAEAIKDYAQKEGHQPYVDLVEKHLGDNALSKLNNNRPTIKKETYSNAIKAMHNESQSEELKDKLTPNTLKFTKSSVNFIESKETINKIIKENEEIKKNIEKPLKPLKKSRFNFLKPQAKIFETEKQNNAIIRENNKINKENEEIRKKNNGTTPKLKSIEENHQELKKSLKEINKLQLEQKIVLSKEIEVSKKGISAGLKAKIIQGRKNLDKKLEKYDKDKNLGNGKGGVVSRVRAAIRPKTKPIQIS
ncbi:MAG: hypothetical protein EKK61_03670 [Rickettsiales bacterium]|nr:MAG: hypothetical protein EKK61_03670 [Rickettsiales bacterium]